MLTFSQLGANVVCFGLKLVVLSAIILFSPTKLLAETKNYNLDLLKGIGLSNRDLTSIIKGTGFLPGLSDVSVLLNGRSREVNSVMFSNLGELCFGPGVHSELVLDESRFNVSEWISESCLDLESIIQTSRVQYRPKRNEVLIWVPDKFVQLSERPQNNHISMVNFSSAYSLRNSVSELPSFGSSSRSYLDVTNTLVVDRATLSFDTSYQNSSLLGEEFRAGGAKAMLPIDSLGAYLSVGERGNSVRYTPDGFYINFSSSQDFDSVGLNEVELRAVFQGAGVVEVLQNGTRIDVVDVDSNTQNLLVYPPSLTDPIELRIFYDDGSVDSQAISRRELEAYSLPAMNLRTVYYFQLTSPRDRSSLFSNDAILSFGGGVPGSNGSLFGYGALAKSYMGAGVSFGKWGRSSYFRVDGDASVTRGDGGDGARAIMSFGRDFGLLNIDSNMSYVSPGFNSSAASDAPLSNGAAVSAGINLGYSFANIVKTGLGARYSRIGEDEAFGGRISLASSLKWLTFGLEYEVADSKKSDSGLSAFATLDLPLGPETRFSSRTSGGTLEHRLSRHTRWGDVGSSQFVITGSGSDVSKFNSRFARSTDVYSYSANLDYNFNTRRRSLNQYLSGAVSSNFESVVFNRAGIKGGDVFVHVDEPTDEVVLNGRSVDLMPWGHGLVRADELKLENHAGFRRSRSGDLNVSNVTDWGQLPLGSVGKIKISTVRRSPALIQITADQNFDGAFVVEGGKFISYVSQSQEFYIDDYQHGMDLELRFPHKEAKSCVISKLDPVDDEYDKTLFRRFRAEVSCEIL